MRARDLSLVMACAALVACSRPRETPRPAPAPRDAGAPAPDIIPPAILMMLDAAAPTIEDAPTVELPPAERITVTRGGASLRMIAPTFTLDSSITRDPTGGTGRWTLTIRGAGGNTVNAGYPITIELSPGGIGVANPSLRRAHAVTYTPQLARFEAALTGADAGETLIAEVLFSVCRSPSDCSFESRNVHVVVP